MPYATSQLRGPEPIDATSLLSIAGATAVLLLSATPALRAAETPVFETLPATGGLLFRLGHGAVVPGSFSLRAGARALRPGVDYALDPTTGTVTLTHPLGPTATLGASYRYDPDHDHAGEPFHFSFAPSLLSESHLSTLYAVSPGSRDGVTAGGQVMGLTLDHKSLGQAFGSGSFSGMWLSSRKGVSPLDALQRSHDGRTSLLTQLAPHGKQGESAGDTLSRYALDGVRVGAARFSAAYRSVGRGFDFSPVESSFQSADAKPLLDRLKHERGLTTLAVDGSMGFHGGASSMMTLRQVSDGKGKAEEQALAYGGRAFDVQYQRVAVGSGFTHAADADLPNAAGVAAGQTRTAFVAAYHPGDAFQLKTSLTRLQTAKGAMETTRQTSLRLRPGKHTEFSAAEERVVTALAQRAAGTRSRMKQDLSIAHQTRGLILKASQQSLTSTDRGKSVQERTQIFHLETDPTRNTLLLFDRKLDLLSGGPQRSSQTARFFTRIARLCTVEWRDDWLRVREQRKLQETYNRSLKVATDPHSPVSAMYAESAEAKAEGPARAIQQMVLAVQGPVPASVSDTTTVDQDGKKTVKTDDLEFTAKPVPQVSVTGTELTHTVDGAESSDLHLALQAKAGAVQIAADERDTTSARNDAKVQETNLSVAANVGSGSDVTGTYLDRRSKGETMKRFQGVGLRRGLLGGRCLVEMGDVRYFQGRRFDTYAFGYSTTKNDKRSLGVTTLFRRMGANDGSQVSEYQYGLDWRPARSWNVSARAYRNDSVRDGFTYRITPVRGDELAIEGLLGRDLRLTMGLTNEVSLTDHTVCRSQKLALKGSLDRLTTLDLNYLASLAPRWRDETPTHWVRMALKRDVGDENRLELSLDARYWSSTDPKQHDRENVNGQIQFTRVF